MLHPVFKRKNNIRFPGHKGVQIIAVADGRGDGNRSFFIVVDAHDLRQAWMLKKYPNVVPIPGSKNKGRIIENLDASLVELSDEEFADLDTRLNSLKVYGHRGFTR